MIFIKYKSHYNTKLMFAYLRCMVADLNDGFSYHILQQKETTITKNLII